MAIITVTGNKGGVGKSTTAVHLATYLSDFGQTLLVDGDPNRTAIKWAERGSLPFKVADERQAVKLAREVEHVVFDTPARPESNDLLELAKGCDLLILPTTPDLVSLEPMLETAAVLNTTNYFFLITIVPSYPSKRGEDMKNDLRAGEIPVFNTTVRMSDGFKTAAEEGVPVRQVKDSRKRAAWKDYEALGSEIMELLS